MAKKQNPLVILYSNMSVVTNFFHDILSRSHIEPIMAGAETYTKKRGDTLFKNSTNFAPQKKDK